MLNYTIKVYVFMFVYVYVYVFVREYTNLSSLLALLSILIQK